MNQTAIFVLPSPYSFLELCAFMLWIFHFLTVYLLNLLQNENRLFNRFSVSHSNHIQGLFAEQRYTKTGLWTTCSLEFSVYILIISLLVKQQGYSTKSSLGHVMCGRCITDANLLHCSIYVSSVWPMVDQNWWLLIGWLSIFSKNQISATWGGF